SYFLGRGEAVLAVENHGVRAVQHENRRARGLILALMDLQVGVVDVQRQSQALPLDRVRESGGDVEVEGVAELVGFRRAAGFDAGGEVTGVMASEAGFAERSQKIAQGLEAEEVERLVGNFKLGLLLG